MNQYQKAILEVLDKNGSLNYNQAWRLSKLPKATFNSTLKDLVQSGLIARSESDKDRRLVLLSINDLGRQALVQSQPVQNSKGQPDPVQNEVIDERTDPTVLSDNTVPDEETSLESLFPFEDRKILECPSCRSWVWIKMKIAIEAGSPIVIITGKEALPRLNRHEIS